MGAGKIMRTLWCNTDERKLTDEQLIDLCKSEELSQHLGNIALFMDRVALLTACDSESGALRDREDVSAMLWGLSATVEALSEAVLIAGDASAILRGRMKHP